MIMVFSHFLISGLLVFSTLPEQSEPSFEAFFSGKTLRVDFVLAGNSRESSIFLDEIRREGEWAGTRVYPKDPFEYGQYKLHITDESTGELIFSKGFCTLYEEWRTTPEADSLCRAFDQVIVFPEPLGPVILEIFERDAKNIFRSGLRVRIDPANPYIPEGLNPDYPYRKLSMQGDPAEKLDLAFLAEGYTGEEAEEFYRDADRFRQAILATEPYKSLENQINFWAVASVSEEAGTDLPGRSVWKNTILNSNFYTFRSERYLTTEDIKSVRDVAGIVPCDVICILVNTDKYGGGGIYNHYAIASSDGPLAEKVLIHELGHALGGLGDEYYSSDVAYEEFFNLDLEPWQPNLTTLVDFESKWKEMVHDSVPVPTPATEAFRNVTGVFEGGGYSAKGIYRPALDCRMKSNNSEEFCEACRQAIKGMIMYYCGK
jgi:hypothetical protein